MVPFRWNSSLLGDRSATYFLPVLFYYNIGIHFTDSISIFVEVCTQYFDDKFCSAILILASSEVFICIRTYLLCYRLLNKRLLSTNVGEINHLLKTSVIQCIHFWEPWMPWYVIAKINGCSRNIFVHNLYLRRNFIFVVELDPFSLALMAEKLFYSDRLFTDYILGKIVIIQTWDLQFLCLLTDRDLKWLIPYRVLASLVDYSCVVWLPIITQWDIGVHLSYGFSVAKKFSLAYFYL